MSEQIDEYVEFVTTSINNYKKYSDELNSNISEINPQTIQYLLASFQSTRLGLLLDVQRRKNDYRKLNRQFKSWWSTKLLEAKRKLTVDGKKFPAVKDYTVQATEDYKTEYDDWQDKLQEAEDKYEFMKTLRDDWNSFQFILQILNSNMVSELRSLNIDRIQTLEIPRAREKK